VVSGGAKKTKIMYQANLSYKLLVKYLRLVMEAGLVTSGSEGSFRLTEKGLDFLRQFNSYRERRRELDEQLRGIRDEKVMLETRFVDAETVNGALRNCASKKSEIKKKKVV